MSWSGVHRRFVCCCYFALILVYSVWAQSICPRLNPPWQGQTIGACGQSEGSVCQFACRTGYILRGSASRVCMSNGLWSGVPASCEQGDTTGNQGLPCPSLSPPAGGTIDGVCNPGQSGQVCHFRCLGNTVLVGQSVLVCLPSGAWNSNPPICQGGTVGGGRCPTLVPPQGGRLLGNCASAATGDTCQLICVSGYRPSDIRQLVCQQNGAWSNTLPQCLPDTSGGCPSIVNTAGRQTSGTCNPGVPGRSCSIACRPGYYLVGSSSVFCQNDNTWSGTIPICRMQTCPGLSPPLYGSYTGSCNPAVTGQSCNFACGSGYRLVGQSSLLCTENGRWTSDPPVCVENSCPTLVAPVNGQIVGVCSAAAVGQSCIFSCRPGFVLVGQSTLVCQASTSWSAPPPSCSGITCPAPVVPINGATSGNCNQAQVGQTCSFACNPGFQLVGASNIVCGGNGQWSGTSPICRISRCPTLVAPANGVISGICSNAAFSDVCIFSCNPNFSLAGQSRLVCGSNGNWASPIPTCAAVVCPSLPMPPNGSYLGSCVTSVVGQNCTFRCNTGFHVVGNSVLSCLAGGRWSSASPSCAPDVCPTLSAPSNGVNSGTCSAAAVGAVCNFSCLSGYALVGEAVLRCLAGPRWSSPSPTCSLVPCPTLAAPANGRISGTCARATIGSMCTFTCADGFGLIGQSILTCQTGSRWSSTSPSCRRLDTMGCPELIPPDNGDFSECDNRSGGRCVVVCNRGYTIVGSRVRTCLRDGRWSGYAPVCTRRKVYGYKVVPLWTFLLG